jgi:serine/threonine protein kinase
VYLADFGITKHAMSRSGLTSTGQFLGTIDYVAPEQIRGTSVLGWPISTRWAACCTSA